MQHQASPPLWGYLGADKPGREAKFRKPQMTPRAGSQAPKALVLGVVAAMVCAFRYRMFGSPRYGRGTFARSGCLLNVMARHVFKTWRHGPNFPGAANKTCNDRHFERPPLQAAPKDEQRNFCAVTVGGLRFWTRSCSVFPHNPRDPHEDLQRQTGRSGARVVCD